MKEKNKQEVFLDENHFKKQRDQTKEIDVITINRS